MKILKRLMLLIFIMFLAFYLGNILFFSNKDGLKLTPSVKATIDKSIPIKGVAVRDEEVITGTKNNSTKYVVENTTKISQNQVIAEVYNSENDINSLNRIEEIDREIAVIQSLNTSATAVNQEVISKNVSDSIRKFNSEIDAGNLRSVLDNKNNILKGMNDRNKILNKDVDYNQKIGALSAEKEEIKKGISGKQKDINSASSGYFISYVDGYENLINQKNINDLSMEQIEEIINNKEIQSDYTVLGKILKGYKWQYVSVVPNDAIEDVEIGDYVELQFAAVNDEKFPANIVDIKKGDTKSTISIECNILNESLATIRNQSAELVLKTYSGIRVNKKALRIVDGEKGVYVMESGLQKFKKIDIKYEDDQYILSEVNTEDDDFLKLYDEVIG